MRIKRRAVHRKGAGGVEKKAAKMASADEHYGTWMEALETILPIIANPDLHSAEDLITAIAKMLRLKGISMEVLRDTSVGAYVRDLCDHPSVQVRSAARIALDCFQTTLFDWADSINWSKEIIANACLEADREIRHRACKSANLAAIDSKMQHIDLRDASNNNTNNVSANLRNDNYMGDSKSGIMDFTSSPSYEEDSLYTPSNPSIYTQPIDRRIRSREPDMYTQPIDKRARLHVHFPNPIH